MVIAIVSDAYEEVNDKWLIFKYLNSQSGNMERDAFISFWKTISRSKETILDQIIIINWQPSLEDDGDSFTGYL